MSYLQQDLGDSILFDSIKGGRLTGVFSREEKELLHKTISKLAEFQVKGANNLKFDNCYPLPEFNRRSVLWDLNYFKYNFLKTTGLEFNEDQLENDFEKIAEALLKDKSDTFMYRDFQSRNVIIFERRTTLSISKRRKGPVYYDSLLLWQAKANFHQI